MSYDVVVMSYDMTYPKSSNRSRPTRRSVAAMRKRWATRANGPRPSTGRPTRSLACTSGVSDAQAFLRGAQRSRWCTERRGAISVSYSDHRRTAASAVR